MTQHYFIICQKRKPYNLMCSKNDVFLFEKPERELFNNKKKQSKLISGHPMILNCDQ